MRSLVSITLVGLLTGCASQRWSTVSAVAVPSPVLVGPKVYVGGGVAPEPSVKHGIHVIQRIFEKESRSETWGEVYHTTKTTTWSSNLMFSYELARVMLEPTPSGFVNEPHAPTDVVRIGKIGIGYLERRDWGSSYDSMSVEVLDAYYFHHVVQSR